MRYRKIEKEKGLNIAIGNKSFMGDKDVWVFLSHSQKDYEKVCKVRNLLEQKSFRPLMFFLRCLEDAKEIDDLIKREIDSRGRFILCDSKNARASEWVRKEVEYIQSKLRMYYTINIDASEDVIAEKISKFIRFSTVFVSYARIDYHIFKQLSKLLKHDWDFDVYDPMNDSFVAKDCTYSMYQELDFALQNGYVFFIVTDNFMKSRWCLEELKYASERKKRNNVIILNSSYIDNNLRENILKCCYLQEIPFEMKDNKLSVDKVRLYFQFMKNSIIERAKLGDKKAKQWLDEIAESSYDIGRKLYYDDRGYENIEKAAYSYLRTAAELGHIQALDLIQNGVWSVDKERE